MKAYQYTSTQTDGTQKVLLLSEHEAFKLCAAMTKDLYGTEAVVRNIETSVKAAEIRLPRSYNRIKEVPPHMHVKGARLGKIFRRDEDGLVKYWSGTNWCVSSSFWNEEEQAGGFFVEFFGDLPRHA